VTRRSSRLWVAPPPTSLPALASAFGRRSLRLLVLAASVSAVAEANWARRLALVAARAGLGFGLFTSYREFMAVEAGPLFAAAICDQRTGPAAAWRSARSGASLASAEGAGR